jgi:hypothetical protein
MSRTYHNKKLKTWLKNRTAYAKSCRHGGDCPYCVGNRTFIRNEDKDLKRAIKYRTILRSTGNDE